MRREQVCDDGSGPGSGHRSAGAEVLKRRNWNPGGDGHTACWKLGWRRMWSYCSRRVQIIITEKGVAGADWRMRSFRQQDKGLKGHSTGKVVKPVRIMTGH